LQKIAAKSARFRSDVAFVAEHQYDIPPRETGPAPPTVTRKEVTRKEVTRERGAHVASSATVPSTEIVRSAETAPATRPAPLAVQRVIDLDRPSEPVFVSYPGTGWRLRARRIPWSLYRYVLFEVLRASFLAMLAVSAIYSAAVGYQTVRSGIQLAFIWPFIAKTFTYPLFCSLPLSLLFGVTLTGGRMVSDLEISAARSNGASHWQLYGPFLLLGLVGAGLGYYLTGWVVPEIHYEKKNLQQYIVRQLESLGSGHNRTILLPEGGGSLFVGSYEGCELKRVHIDLKRELQQTFVPNVRDQLPAKLPESVSLLAQEGTLEITEDQRGLNLHLRGVDILIPEKISGTKSGHDNFIQKFSISESLSIPLSFEKRHRGVKDRTNTQLAEFIDELKTRLDLDPNDRRARKYLLQAKSQWHQRIAFSLSGFLFPFIGVTLCFLLNLRSRLVPFFVGNLVVLVVFYPLLMVGSYMARSGALPPGIALALPTVGLGVLGALLTRKVLEQ
jgi:lipopolysaccharide export LptBFGC system permease protein LptF